MLKKKVSLPSEKIQSPVTAFIALENYNAIKLIHVRRQYLACFFKIIINVFSLVGSF